jgi:hypothetical protein
VKVPRGSHAEIGSFLYQNLTLYYFIHLFKLYPGSMPATTTMGFCVFFFPLGFSAMYSTKVFFVGTCD